VRSYWKVVQGLASRNTGTLNAMGFYDDFCVKLPLADQGEAHLPLR
jgi:hypothetical protein